LPFDVCTDGRFGAREGGADSAGVGAASRSRRRSDSSETRLGRIRPFGGDATSTGDGSAFLAPNAAADARRHSRSNPACGDLVSDDSASGFELVASLGRRRTSTVNEGTARLNVVLDTARRWADSSLPKMTLRGTAQQSNRQLLWRRQTGHFNHHARRRKTGWSHVTASCAWERRIRTSGMELTRQGPLFAARRVPDQIETEPPLPSQPNPLNGPRSATEELMDASGDQLCESCS
jgi:hypothetical protein